MCRKVCSICKEEKELSEFYKHIRVKSGYRAECKICSKKQLLGYYESHKEKWAYNPNMSEEQRKKRNEKSSIYRSRNKEKEKERHRIYAEKNKEKKLKSGRANYHKNREKYREYARKYRKEYPEIHALNEQTRRARKLSNGGKIEIQEWDDLCNHFGNKCLSCGRGDIKLTIDHVVPIFLGGTNTIDNVQPLCHSCNSSKGIKIIDYRNVENK